MFLELRTDGYLVDKVLDKNGMKGNGKWTVQQATDLSVAGGLGDILSDQAVDKKKLIDDTKLKYANLFQIHVMEEVEKPNLASESAAFASNQENSMIRGS
ncbi:hypothetical protein Q3G72_026041 [Acer saccharum]|nr:hypothetical protein Q3G72_026041 [Acer saccharum]